MGMDVIGTNPTSEVGECFHNSVWKWRPLWEYCCDVFPTCREVSGHSNDGDGLDAVQARKLAGILTRELALGRAAVHQRRVIHAQDALPDVSCDACGGTGKRRALATEACRACGGRGVRRPIEAWYEFSVENVEAFRDFLTACGGFEIW